MGERVDSFQVGGCRIRLVTDDPRIRRYLLRGPLEGLLDRGGKTGDFDFTVEMLSAAAKKERGSIFDQPPLPLETTKLQLRRERMIRGWVFGDALHLEDGEHELDLHYQKHWARAYFSPAIHQQVRLLTHSYFMVAVIELLRTQQMYYLHAGLAVSPNGMGVIFLGDGGSGKSTSLYMLVRAGWSLVADDALLLATNEDNQITAHRLLHRFLLHGTMVHWFPGLILERVDSDGKGHVSPTVLPPNCRLAQATPLQVVILQPKKTGQSRLLPVRRSALLAEMIHQNAFLFLHPQLAAHHLEALSKLAQQCEPFRLERGEDLLHHPEKLVQLLEEHCHEPASEVVV